MGKDRHTAFLKRKVFEGGHCITDCKRCRGYYLRAAIFRGNMVLASIIIVFCMYVICRHRVINVFFSHSLSFSLLPLPPPLPGVLDFFSGLSLATGGGELVDLVVRQQSLPGDHQLHPPLPDGGTAAKVREGEEGGGREQEVVGRKDKHLRAVMCDVRSLSGKCDMIIMY